MIFIVFQVEEVEMSQEQYKVEEQKQPIDRTKPKLFSRIFPWYVSLAIAEPISRLFEPTQKIMGLIAPYIKNGHLVTDLGCGRGYYTLALADLVGHEGKVYAVDLDKKCIQALKKKADKGGYHNIEAHASSAADVSFIKDKSVDFLLANGLLCSMVDHRQSAANEIKRILNPKGHAYISLGFGPPLGYVDKLEWEKILQEFKVERGGSFKEKWSVVSLKQE
jgi:ubiquinone/menaquinone biosynthesis C-methylase UbiE